MWQLGLQCSNLRTNSADLLSCDSSASIAQIWLEAKRPKVSNKVRHSSAGVLLKTLTQTPVHNALLPQIIGLSRLQFSDQQKHKSVRNTFKPVIRNHQLSRLFSDNQHYAKYAQFFFLNLWMWWQKVCNWIFNILSAAHCYGRSVVQDYSQVKIHAQCT